MKGKLTIFQQVRELEGWPAVAFCATLIERMLPNYQLFCEASGYDDAEQFRKTLNSIWEYLSTPKARINFAVQLEKVEVLIPDPADFDTYGVYPAVDVGMSMAACINLIRGDDPQGAVVVAKLSQGSVEAFIEAMAEKQTDPAAVKGHPLMQWEIEFQQALLSRLAEQKPGRELAKLLREMALEEGVSNLGIEA